MIGIASSAIFVRNRKQSQTVSHDELAYGLVWFGTNGRSQPAVTGQANSYFDPTRPTIIFVHGWLPDQVATPPTFLVEIKDEERDVEYHLDLTTAWVEAGWNIGIFYWHPFADEELVWVAEDKIWTPDEEAAMRYRDAAGNYHTDGMPSVSAAELFYEAYLEAMQDFSGPEIRIAGHSLGDAIDTGEVAANLLPSRLALLDPFWSPFPKSYLDGQETGAVIRQEIIDRLLPRDVLVEWYRSSLLTQETMLAGDIPDFQAQIAYAELAPDFCSLLDQVCRHDGAWHLYFLSYGSPAPRECVLDDLSESCMPTGERGPMASTTHEQLAAMMGQPVYWVHGLGPDGEDGRYTPQTDDDWFHRIPLEE